MASKRRTRRMLFLFSIVALLLGLSHAESISIVDRNTPDIKTRLISAQFTDFLPRKVTLYAVDYFRIPSTLNTTSNLTTASFTFATLRSRSDRDPESLTLVLFYKNTSTGGVDMPAATPFFSKRVNAPGEPPEWQNASMTTIVYIQVNISNGEKSEDDASVVFDLANASLLPRDTLMWAGFYMTGSRNHSFETGLDNCLYWVMNNITQVDNTTTNETGSFFYHLDSGNTVSHSLECWNNASAVATKFRIDTSSLQMAWTLRLLSDDSTSYFDYYMKRMGTKELVIIVFASIAGFIVLCVCSCWCVRKCRLVSLRRRERARQGSNASKGVENLNTSFYSPVYSPKDGIPLEVWSTDDAPSLDSSKQQHTVRFDDIPIGTTETTTTQGKKYTPAGRFINNLQKETKFI